MADIHALPYNGTTPTGGDSLIQDLNVYYEVSMLLPSLRTLTSFHLVRRHRLDAGSDRPRLVHGPWGWVRDVHQTLKITLLAHHYDSFFYSGLARRKSALSLIWVTLMAVGVTSFQWFFWGYSLAFSHSAGKFLGDLSNIGFRNVLAAPSVASERIPDLLFAVYQGMFASIT